MRFSCADARADNCREDSPAGFPFVLLPFAPCVLLPLFPFKECETPLEEELFPLLKGEPMRERRADTGTSDTAWVQCRPGSGRKVPSNSRSRGQALPTTPGVCNSNAHHENTRGANYPLAICRAGQLRVARRSGGIPSRSQIIRDNCRFRDGFAFSLYEVRVANRSDAFRRFQSLVRMAAPCPARWHDAKYRRSSCFTSLLRSKRRPATDSARDSAS
jgi:hypothetical protein